MHKFLATAAVALALVASNAAAESKTYKISGPVVAVDDNKIVIQKGKEKIELARSDDSNIPSDVKVGDKVTAEYAMTATTVNVQKPEQASKAPAASKSKAQAKGKAKDANKIAPAAGNADTIAIPNTNLSFKKQ
jgi:hypothetical protein